MDKMQTRLYYDDTYLTEFEANVVEQYRKGDRFAVVLNRTAFYPTSGGQMNDLGFLNEMKVLDVREEGGEVIHLVEQPFKEKTVAGKIDWPRRFSFMQQHTAFHILAQSFLRILRLQTVSSHLGESRSTIDIDTAEIRWEEIESAEKLANQVVFENCPVKSFWVEKGELELLSLRKPPQDFQKPIRLVSIKDFDLDPCGGTHVRNTGEVGIIKILSWEKIRGNIRCTFQAGWRALEDYQLRVKTTEAISQTLSVANEEMPDQVAFLKSKLKEREKQLEKKSELLLQLESNELIENRRNHAEEIWKAEIAGKTPAEIRFIAKAAAKKAPVGLVLYSHEEPVFVAIASTGSEEKDLRLFVSELRQSMQFRGGGQPNFVELHGLDRTKVSEVVGRLKTFLARG